MTAQIDLQNIDVTFGNVKAVKDVTLQVEKGDIYGVIGFSGAGKSTLVRTINLLQEPSNGSVSVNGTTLFKNQKLQISKKQLQEKRRKIGMIFQHFNLLNEETVLENVAFALKHAGLNDEELEKRCLHLLDLVGLKDYADHYPAQLSGGQQQRVAIARALANEPDILISDEATSALDPKTTNQILDLLYDLNKKLQLTVVLITHEMDAVKRVANKIAVMENGQIIEKGNLREIYLHPQKELTKQFVGGALEAQHILNTYHLESVSAQDQLYQLVYKINDVTKSVVADLDVALNTKASILYGNVEVLSGEAIGTLAILLKLDSEKQKQAIKFLEEKNVVVTKLDKGVLTDD
ncbi:methionine ABC transporter ATP-binding protein [Lactobacillus hominis]|uniref:Methionine import ATP-binding protein MetN n=1 Tax=Lactobacillus hominis DSM 23910 = CRBIP 24.179 TaxID=1423758 RepID=I7JV47_9LACO|nr:ATP-binding cassette domain-containing protein [Lactobacillus hominis]KRM84434.1 abc transporter atpase component [Lactobacillus hominis DSM 23910 = CRBIP 24.179]MCT3348514.1 ATP-binding cassette domain-containing protein [Lactobacillus hominis]CCI82206.1 Methionine import ATP-binding protein MetN [Lactobacillus hominis DSM 23910 = CRBIP 24.179]